MKLYLNARDNQSETLTKKDYLLRAAERLGFEFVIDYKPQQHHDVDYILNIEPYDNFFKGKKWTGLWEIDLILDRPNLSLSDWVESEVVFVANNVFPERTRPHKHKTLLLFQACDPVLHRPNDRKKEFDFVFSGSTGGEFYQERSHAIKLLSQRFSFQDFGKGYGLEEYIHHLNKARVQFIRTGSSEGADGHLAQRFFECLALGPVLTNYHPDLELTGLIEGADYLSYRTDNEMIQKMNYLVNHPQEAQLIARRGRQRALALHTYEHRLITIINLLPGEHETKYVQ